MLGWCAYFSIQRVLLFTDGVKDIASRPGEKCYLRTYISLDVWVGSIKAAVVTVVY